MHSFLSSNVWLVGLPCLFNVASVLTFSKKSLERFKLSRICNHQIGMGFNAYLKSLRVTAAMRRLAFTNKGMQEIALGCGFESVRTFNRAFSEETGISPSEYRRAQQQCTALNLDVNPAPAKKSE